MSGAEASFVVGLISGVISIIDEAKKIYDAAKDAEGQPEAFRQVAARLPLVIEILHRVEVKTRALNETAQDPLEQILKSCKAKAEKLQEVFHKVIRKDDDKWYDRYKRALSTLGKGDKVESLMGEILKDVQVIACEKLEGTATEDQLKKLEEAIKEMKEIPPSLTDEAGTVTQTHSGSGDNIGHSGSGNIYAGNAHHSQHTGDVNYGSNSTFNNYAAPERLETPPNPSIVVPFSRDADFVQRGAILDQIYQHCTVFGSRTALVGLGGVGKSQLAIEYAYRTRDQSPETWVFWVHASNTARFEQSFRDIANYVKIPGRQNPNANIFQLVHDWLRDDRKGVWVVILDNVDDASYLVEARSIRQDGQVNGIGTRNLRALTDYLPQCLNGSVLITTRSKSAALELVEQRHIITVEPMGRADALVLFKNKLGSSDDSNDTAELATALEFMPLAIVHAAAYISQRAPRYSVREYLQDFQKSDRKRTSLLNYEGGQLRRDKDAKNSIIITWQMSFDRIRQIRPSATDLLALMSLCDRQGIPETLVRSQAEVKNSLQKGQWLARLFHSNKDRYRCEEQDNTSLERTDGFEDDVLMLRNYSFISISKNQSTFDMHALVQLAMRTWMETNGQLERWKQRYIKSLCAEFPTGHYENWPKCEKLFPHAQSAVAQRPEGQASLRDWASILYKAAWYALQIGNWVEAEKMSVKAMEVRRRILGREHNDTLHSMSMVGSVYNIGGRWGAAEELFMQVMEIRKKKLGADHPDTLSSMANLALTYGNQGRWDAAEELEVQMMDMSKKLRADHPSILISMGNLAFTYRNQGRWDDAEELEMQVMEIRKEKLGVDHPDTLSSMSNLASIYTNQGRWDAAEELFVQVMEICKKKLGADHPSTLRSIGNLASTYGNQGRWDAAEELEVQVMEIRKKKLGADHPDTLISMGNLASTYANQGQWFTAEELEVQVMEINKKKLGADHPSTLISMGNLASTYRNQGGWDAAEELEVQVMEIRKEKLGADHPDTLRSMANLSCTWKGQNRDAEAQDLMSSCLKLVSRKLGADHPNTLAWTRTYNSWSIGSRGSF